MISTQFSQVSRNAHLIVAHPSKRGGEAEDHGGLGPWGGSDVASSGTHVAATIGASRTGDCLRVPDDARLVAARPLNPAD